MTTSQPNPIESRLDRIERNLEQTTERLNQFALNQIQLQQNIDRVDARLEATITETASLVFQIIQDAATDREAWLAESRRVWEYLLGQQSGNGRES